MTARYGHFDIYPGHVRRTLEDIKDQNYRYRFDYPDDFIQIVKWLPEELFSFLAARLPMSVTESFGG